MFAGLINETALLESLGWDEEAYGQLIEFIEQGIEQKDRDTLSMLAKWFMNDITGKKAKIDRETIPSDLLGGA